MPNQTLLHAILRQDLSAFIEKTYNTVDGSQKYVSAPHIELLADKLTACVNGDINRLIINLPPRSLKSISASVAFPAWLLGKNPSNRIITISYSDDLAAKHARDCRALMDCDWYKKTFSKTRISPRKRSETEYETTENGYRLSTSLGGTLTGRGGNMIIIDDPIKPQDVIIEDKSSGTGLIQQLMHEGIPTIAYQPKGSKQDRICAQSSALESGSVFLPKKAPWLDGFKLEVISFPYGKHDDQIDALSQALDWARTGNISILDVL